VEYKGGEKKTVGRAGEKKRRACAGRNKKKNQKKGGSPKGEETSSKNRGGHRRRRPVKGGRGCKEWPLTTGPGFNKKICRQGGNSRPRREKPPFQRGPWSQKKRLHTQPPSKKKGVQGRKKEPCRSKKKKRGRTGEGPWPQSGGAFWKLRPGGGEVGMWRGTGGPKRLTSPPKLRKKRKRNARPSEGSQ